MPWKIHCYNSDSPWKHWPIILFPVNPPKKIFFINAGHWKSFKYIPKNLSLQFFQSPGLCLWQSFKTILNKSPLNHWQRSGNKNSSRSPLGKMIFGRSLSLINSKLWSDCSSKIHVCGFRLKNFQEGLWTKWRLSRHWRLPMPIRTRKGLSRSMQKIFIFIGVFSRRQEIFPPLPEYIFIGTKSFTVL